MKSNKALSVKAVAGILALGIGMSSTAYAVPESPKEWEKCLGVAKKGQNDCASKNGSHECAGDAPKDNDPNEYIYVPKDTCVKIVNGKVWQVVKADS